MIKSERGFTLVETLVSLLIGTTLMGFVIPLYLTGKQFTNDRMLENQARGTAQAVLEESLSMLQVRKQTWTMKSYRIQEEVTFSKPIWKLVIVVKWKNSQKQMRMIKLETHRFQNADLPISK